MFLDMKWIDLLQELIQSNLDTQDARMPPFRMIDLAFETDVSPKCRLQASNQMWSLSSVSLPMNTTPEVHRAPAE